MPGWLRSQKGLTGRPSNFSWSPVKRTVKKFLIMSIIWAWCILDESISFWMCGLALWGSGHDSWPIGTQIKVDLSGRDKQPSPPFFSQRAKHPLYLRLTLSEKFFFKKIHPPAITGNVNRIDYTNRLRNRLSVHCLWWSTEDGFLCGATL